MTRVGPQRHKKKKLIVQIRDNDTIAHETKAYQDSAVLGPLILILGTTESRGEWSISRS